MPFHLIGNARSYVEKRIVPLLARLYRPALVDTSFVAVTGSCGKTTAKELIANVLSVHAPTHSSFDSNNRYFSVARTLLEVRRRHRFCVIELGASGPGSLRQSIRLLAPHIAVVTTVGSDHYKAFRGPDAVAKEKSELVSALGPDGTAVLNRDDSLVMSMADRCRGKVLTFGFSGDADVHGEILSSQWPEPLKMRITYQGASTTMTTRIYGNHLAPLLLAAFAVAMICSVDRDRAAGALADVRPLFGRMSIERRSDGVIFIHDHFKAPYWSMSPVLDYVANARARQKIVVIGTVSDYPGSASAKYRKIAEQALAAADHVVFANQNASAYFRRFPAKKARRLHFSDTTYGAAKLLEKLLSPGTVVLLKGSIRADHLERISMFDSGRVRCRAMSCGREIFCHDCDLRDQSPDCSPVAASTGQRHE